MPDQRSCPECGTTLPAGASREPCPKCRAGSRPAGRPGVGIEEFRRAVVALGLIADDELEPFESADVSRLARALVRSGKLTAYQAAAIAQGKARGLLVGDHLVLDKLGQGGMGVVFKARQRWSGRVVALKILPPSFARDRYAVSRFRREFEVAARLKHPNVVPAIEADEDRGVQFLTMEYVDGYDLHDVVSDVGPLPVKMALDCAIQAARGLAAAHAQGIVHRDVKPGNLMLDASGAVRVLDLGLARVVEAANPLGSASEGNLTRTGAYIGTVDYIAPEQADDPKTADHRADVYSLGCTLYYLLTGRPPFTGPTALKRLIAHQESPAPSLWAVRSDVTEAIDDAYQKMLAKRPGDRPGSMAEVVALLEACRSSADEGRDARAGLKGYAERMVKRAGTGPGRRDRSRDASVFAPSVDTGGVRLDPGLSFEDLVMDLRPEHRPEPLAAGQLPPRGPRAVPQPAPAHRRSTALVGWAVAAVATAYGGYRLVLRIASKPAAVAPSADLAASAALPAPPPRPKPPPPRAKPPQAKPEPVAGKAPWEVATRPATRLFRFATADDAIRAARESWGKHQDEDALAAYREAARLGPGRSGYGDVGRALSDLGQFDEAVEVLREGIRKFPDDAGLYNSLAWVLTATPDTSRRDHAEALAQVRTAIRLNPQDGTFRNTLGTVQYHMGDLDGATATFRGLLKTKNGVANPWDLFVMAMIDQAKGRRDEARKLFDRAVEGAGRYGSGGNRLPDDLRRLWSEAAALLGRPGPDEGR